MDKPHILPSFITHGRCALVYMRTIQCHDNWSSFSPGKDRIAKCIGLIDDGKFVVATCALRSTLFPGSKLVYIEMRKPLGARGT